MREGSGLGAGRSRGVGRSGGGGVKSCSFGGCRCVRA